MVPIVLGVSTNSGPDSLEKPNPNAAPVILRAKLHYGPPLVGYTLALALVIASGAIRLALIKQQPWAPFLFFYPAVAVTSFLGGAGPGMAATVFGAIFAFFLFPEPPTPQSWLALSVLGPLFSTGFAHLRLLRDQHNAAAKELASFKFIGDHASDWILLLDSSGRIRYANLRACTELGWTERELTGRRVDSFVPESEKAGVARMLEAARSGTARPIELTFTRRNGTEALIELGCTGVRTGGEHVVHAAARDIGERKRIEQERKRIEERLREVRHWESLGRMAGGLAHDFNNLLTSIIGYASLAKNSVTPGHEAGPMLDNIIEAGESSAELVRMLLATAGYRPRINERVQLDQLLDWILANRPLPANVTVAREADSTVCNGDRRSFETLLWSLLLNAAESYGQAGGKVTVALRTGLAPPQTTKVSFDEGDAGTAECLGIIVEDTGCGMTPEVLERAFDPFFTTKLPGRGLGLPAVRGIVRAYSGKLLVETAAGRGTRVEVWLPV